MTEDYRYEYRAKAASMILGEQPEAEKFLVEFLELTDGIYGLTIMNLMSILMLAEDKLKEYWV